MSIESLYELIKADSLELTVEDIEGIMNEELNKPIEEMDVELIALCADALKKADEKYEQIKTDEPLKKNNIVRLKRKSLVKMLAAAALSVMIIISSNIFIFANYKENNIFATNKKLITFDECYFIDFNLGKHEAIHHSSSNLLLVRKLEKYGYGKVVLPTALLSDEYTYTIENHDNNINFMSNTILFTNKNDGSRIRVRLFLGRKGYAESRGIQTVTEDFHQMRQLTANGLDAVLVCYNKDESSEAFYYDNLINYEFTIDTNYNKAIEIMKTLDYN